jgi:hypothetical protein
MQLHQFSIKWIGQYFSRIAFAILLFIESFSLCKYVIYLLTENER